MKKLTDAEIIESFTRTYEQYKEKGDFRTTVYEEILDLIKRKDAEIERLDKLVIYNASCCTRLHKDLFNAKTEAIKEFAERLKKEFIAKPTYHEATMYVCAVVIETVDNLVKEMVGENNAQFTMQNSQLELLREKCIEHQDFHKGDDGKFRGWISVEDLDRVIDEL